MKQKLNDYYIANRPLFEIGAIVLILTGLILNIPYLGGLSGEILAQLRFSLLVGSDIVLILLIIPFIEVVFGYLFPESGNTTDTQQNSVEQIRQNYRPMLIMIFILLIFIFFILNLFAFVFLNYFKATILMTMIIFCYCIFYGLRDWMLKQSSWIRIILLIILLLIFPILFYSINYISVGSQIKQWYFGISMIL